MKFEVQEATPADLETAKSIYGSQTGDLTAAALLTWPLTDANAKERAEWSGQQQKDLLENDPTVRYVKVVDADKNDEIVALGRWHRYVNGYHHVADLETVGLKDRNDASTFPEGFNEEFYLGMLDDVFDARRSWMGEGHYWVLTNLKTREPLRRNGAGTLILKWGLDQAAEEGVPAYLEAATGAMSLYQKHGFRELDRVEVDGAKYGMPGAGFQFARMRADPK